MFIKNSRYDGLALVSYLNNYYFLYKEQLFYQSIKVLSDFWLGIINLKKRKALKKR